MADPAAIAEEEIIAEQSYDANDPEQVNSARKRAGRERREEMEVIAALMKVPQGRRWLYNKLAFCRVFTSPFAESPYQTAFNSGRQAVGHLLQEDIMASSPDLYMTMCLEGAENNKRRTKK